MIKVLLERSIKGKQVREITRLLRMMRVLAMQQPGYISGETMRHVSNPDEYLVISTWDTLEDWEKWVSSPPRKALQDKIDKLLGKKTTYDIYHYPEKRYHKAEPSDYLERSPSNPKK